MKKLFFLLVLLPITGHAQIKVLNTAKKEVIGKVFVGGFESFKLDDRYFIMYQDAQYSQLTEFKSFEVGSKEDFNQLYDLILNGFVDTPEDEVTLELPNDIIVLDYVKAVGVVNVRVYHHVDKSAGVVGLTGWMNQKRLSKLFGR